ncbi:hypothetical protein J2S78_002080 [Salibacterium salarium]|uniref:hypothetical protein n=1 Tax=Salibacterium salarium TaxID=284579 RepID=UPI00278405A3|nr:hypothetical protein [Salibacterium salarium]MDQ0299660.1 hypothetical protein [Salibacterium salarium]
MELLTNYFGRYNELTILDFILIGLLSGLLISLVKWILKKVWNLIRDRIYAFTSYVNDELERRKRYKNGNLTATDRLILAAKSKEKLSKNEKRALENLDSEKNDYHNKQTKF